MHPNSVAHPAQEMEATRLSGSANPRKIKKWGWTGTGEGVVE